MNGYRVSCQCIYCNSRLTIGGHLKGKRPAGAGPYIHRYKMYSSQKDADWLFLFFFPDFVTYAFFNMFFFYILIGVVSFD